jgi:hypothetical protein
MEVKVRGNAQRLLIGYACGLGGTPGEPGIEYRQNQFLKIFFYDFPQYTNLFFISNKKQVYIGPIYH